MSESIIKTRVRTIKSSSGLEQVETDYSKEDWLKLKEELKI